MALVALPGTPFVPIGPGLAAPSSAAPGGSSQLANTVGGAVICIGHVVTSDGGSHTINTTGSSSLGWRAGTTTFASASTTVKVGLAAVDTAAGPPGRAVNVADVITFDVSKSLIGGGGGITTGAWQTHVPDTGSKVIANGDLVAFCVQMTARGGTDSVAVGCLSTAAHLIPSVTTYASPSYSAVSSVPDVIIAFSDGAIGFFYLGEVYNTISNTLWHSGSTNAEYGQLFNLPFPMKIYGIYGWLNLSAGNADTEVVLYSAPLSGTPVAEQTKMLDANTILRTGATRFVALFNSPYAYNANTDIAAVFKPGSTSIIAYYKTLANAAHRIADVFGTSGYGISRLTGATGAFANANSDLDHYYIGLLAGAFDAGGGGGGRVVQINNNSLVA